MHGYLNGGPVFAARAISGVPGRMEGKVQTGYIPRQVQPRWRYQNLFRESGLVLTFVNPATRRLQLWRQ